jgi:ACR3 family arsenite efflux pump ArsB
VPILFQVYLNAGIADWLCRRLGVAWCVAGPSALIGAFNFFELAVAADNSLFVSPPAPLWQLSSVCWSRCQSCSRSCPW